MKKSFVALLGRRRGREPRLGGRHHVPGPESTCPLATASARSLCRVLARARISRAVSCSTPCLPLGARCCRARSGSRLSGPRRHAPFGGRPRRPPLSALLVLGVTTQAAPIMFRIGASPNDPAAIEPLADRFAALTNTRALLADAGAVALLWALTTCALRAAAGQMTECSGLPRAGRRVSPLRRQRMTHGPASSSSRLVGAERVRSLLASWDEATGRGASVPAMRRVARQARGRRRDGQPA